MWPAGFDQDYAGAAVRLVTVAEKGASHLLFACVELYPREIPVPPGTMGESLNLGDARLIFGLAPLSLRDALTWYEEALQGRLRVPGTTFVVTSPPLGAEPMMGRLVCPHHVPFAPTWHAHPRMHRLVPLGDPGNPVQKLVSLSDPTERQMKARRWLAERVHFDLLAHDDWISGIALLAPNPVARAFHIAGSPPSPSGDEAFAISVPPRQGMSSASLLVRLREVRFGAISGAWDIALDQCGNGEIALPELSHSITADLVCPVRGLLCVMGEGRIIRTAIANLDVVGASVGIEVPSPRRGGRPSAYAKEVRRREEISVGVDLTSRAAKRLAELWRRRTRRTGEARPDAPWYGRLDEEVVFYDDRAAAAAFIRARIETAKRQMILVDPFFDHVALREFALATVYPEIDVRVLLGRDHLKRSSDEASPPAGDVLAGELEEIARHNGSRVFSPIDLRLMGDACRKYHDRFLVIDDEVWHCGHSFNQVGRGEVSMMGLVRYPDALRQTILDDLDRAEDFAAFWKVVLAERAVAESTASASGAGASRRSTLLEGLRFWFSRMMRRLGRDRSGT
ncbi:VPA1262 family N-terminal domain-containing protein [Methylobacterium sp. CM6241]